MNKKILIFVGLVAILLGAFFALRDKTAAIINQSNKIQITTSFYPLYYFVSQIGGDRVQVADITPAGVEPHDYEPTAQDVANLESSRLIFLNGGGFEPWSKTLDQIIDPTKTRIVVLGDGLVDKDPHIWLNPMMAKEMAGRIADELSYIDQPNAHYYSMNVLELQKKLDTLDEAYKSGLRNCLKHEIITSHAAFGYLARAYDLKQMSVAGISPDAEPSAKQLVEIAKFAKQNGIKYIFTESLVSPKLSDTIALEVGAKTLVLNPIESLSSGDLAAGKDYITVMLGNLENLKIALQCN